MKLISRIALSLAATAGPVSVAASADYDPPIYVEDALEVRRIGSAVIWRRSGYAFETEIGW